MYAQLAFICIIISITAMHFWHLISIKIIIFSSWIFPSKNLTLSGIYVCLQASSVFTMSINLWMYFYSFVPCSAWSIIYESILIVSAMPPVCQHLSLSKLSWLYIFWWERMVQMKVSYWPIVYCLGCLYYLLTLIKCIIFFRIKNLSGMWNSVSVL